MSKIIDIGVILIYWMASFSIIIYGYVPEEEYKGYKIKYYHPGINKTECENNLDQIPERYKQGVYMFRFYEKGQHRYFFRNLGGCYYFILEMIDIYQGCNMEIIIHELAHHKNKMDGYMFPITDQHGETFLKAEQEIKENLIGNEIIK